MSISRNLGLEVIWDLNPSTSTWVAGISSSVLTPVTNVYPNILKTCWSNHACLGTSSVLLFPRQLYAELGSPTWGRAGTLLKLYIWMESSGVTTHRYLGDNCPGLLWPPGEWRLQRVTQRLPPCPLWFHSAYTGSCCVDKQACILHFRWLAVYVCGLSYNCDCLAAFASSSFITFLFHYFTAGDCSPW